MPAVNVHFRVNNYIACVYSGCSSLSYKDSVQLVDLLGVADVSLSGDAIV